MKTIGFQKRYTTDKDFVIVELFEDGSNREGIDPNNYEIYKNYNGIIQNISGNKYITITSNNEVIYNKEQKEKDELSLQWSNIIELIEYQLNDTAWYMLSDSGLTSEQFTIAAQWRKDMMNIPSVYNTITDATTAYNTLISNKPKYELKHGVI